MIILDESRAEEQARKEAGLARIEQVNSSATRSTTKALGSEPVGNFEELERGVEAVRCQRSSPT